jgi:hypothetical protein
MRSFFLFFLKYFNKNNKMKKIIEELPWPIVLLVCLTLGLAPFSPPHILEKLQMLAAGKLVKPIDWFDLFLHGTPWLILIVKIAFFLQKKSDNH